jgi:hypothetical protein
MSENETPVVETELDTEVDSATEKAPKKSWR